MVWTLGAGAALKHGTGQSLQLDLNPDHEIALHVNFASIEGMSMDLRIRPPYPVVCKSGPDKYGPSFFSTKWFVMLQ